MDWVHCNKCFYQPSQQPKRRFLMTSCGHIFCKCCEHSEQVERCKFCGAVCSSTLLSAEMEENVRVYFEDPETTLEKTLKVVEFQKFHRLKLIEYLKTVWEKYQRLKFAYQKMEEENKGLKKEIDMYRKQQSLMTPPASSPNIPIFNHSSQTPQFLRMHSQSPRTPSSPFFVTPTRPASSSQNYRNLNMPSTPASDNSTSPLSVSSQQSYRSRGDGRSNSQQRIYRPGLTPALNSLSLLSVNGEYARDASSSSRY